VRHWEWHRTDRIGGLRAAALGANDGIVSTASLVLGVAAANGTHSSVMVAGIAGLVAGATSMAARSAMRWFISGISCCERRGHSMKNRYGVRPRRCIYTGAVRHSWTAVLGLRGRWRCHHFAARGRVHAQ
jgi:hypothetical protein